MTSLKNEAARALLLNTFSDALHQALGTSGAAIVQCTPKPEVSSSLPEADACLVAKMRLRGTLHGEIYLMLARSAASAVLSEVAEATPEQLAARWQSLADGFVQRLPKRAADAGMYPFSVESHTVGEPPADRGECLGEFELIATDGPRGQLYLFAQEEMIAALQTAEWKGLSGVRGSTTGRDAQIGRVIDVPLAVTLRFGQRQMRLREVLELGTGSLVELDRQVEDPVDLLLGERVIARGEVVIVDGNYGLRVTEIVESPTLPLSA